MGRQAAKKRRLGVSKETIRKLEPRALRDQELQHVVGGGCMKPSVCCTTSDY
jgi:hypothetical protein